MSSDAQPAAEQRADIDTFLSGESGYVAGIRLGVKRTLADWAIDAGLALGGTRRALDRLAEAQPARSVHVLSIYRPGSRLATAVRELRSGRHDVTFTLGSTAAADPALVPETAATNLDGGKFQNLNALLANAPPGPFDWTLVVDDDVHLAERFLDRFLPLCERLGFQLAQPAQTQRSHAAWRVTRRRLGCVARQTAFVEIGPVTAFAPGPAAELMPFPDTRFGWGLDNHWAAIARDRGWRLGVVDALPVRHDSQPVATTYTHAEAKEEAGRFMAGRDYVTKEEANRTLATHRRVPRP